MMSDTATLPKAEAHSTNFNIHARRSASTPALVQGQGQGSQLHTRPLCPVLLAGSVPAPQQLRLWAAACEHFCGPDELQAARHKTPRTLQTPRNATLPVLAGAILRAGRAAGGRERYSGGPHAGPDVRHGSSWRGACHAHRQQARQRTLDVLDTCWRTCRVWRPVTGAGQPLHVHAGGFRAGAAGLGRAGHVCACMHVAASCHGCLLSMGGCCRSVSLVGDGNVSMLLTTTIPFIQAKPAHAVAAAEPHQSLAGVDSQAMLCRSRQARTSSCTVRCAEGHSWRLAQLHRPCHALPATQGQRSSSREGH